MKDGLKQSTKSSKSESNLKSTKELEQRTNQSMGRNTYKAPIVFKEVGVEAKGVRALAKWAYSPPCPRAKLCLNQCGKSRTKTEMFFIEGVLIKRI
jgi:hypothetical protein